MGQPKQSVLLVELTDLRQIPGRTDDIFPLLRGRYHALGIASHWIRFAVGLDEECPPAAGGVELCDADFRHLCQAAREYEATEILLSGPLTADQAEELARRAPDATVLSASDPATLTELKALELARIEPRYEWDPGNAAAASKHMDVVHLTLSQPDAARCNSLEWLGRQVAGIRRSRRHPHGYPKAVALEVIQNSDQVAACIAALCRNQLEEHIELWLALRADQTPEVVDTIREHFSAAPASRLRVLVYACAAGALAPSRPAPGASDVTVLERLRCINELRQLAHEHRGRFWYRGLDLELDEGLVSHFRLREWETRGQQWGSPEIESSKAEASLQTTPGAADAGAGTRRIGDQQVGLAELLRRLTPLLTQGLKPTLAIDGVTRAELHDGADAVLEQAGTAHRLVDDRSSSSPAKRVLLVARDENTLRQAGAALRGLAALTGATARRDAVHRLGGLFGYPECCVRKYSARSMEGEHSLTWSALAVRATSAGSIPPPLRPLLVPALAFVPCSAECARAAALYSRWFSLLDGNVAEHADADVAEWFAFDGEEHVSLRVVQRDQDSIHYDPRSAAQATGPTSDWLRAGDRLRFVPAQIQICAGDDLLGTRTATHAVWDPARCWHPATWRELSRAVLTRRLAAALPPVRIEWGRGANLHARAEDDTPQSDHSRFCQHIKAALSSSADTLHARTGYAVGAVTNAGTGVQVLLNNGANRLELWVEPARTATRAFRRSHEVAISHSPDTPVDTQEKRSVVAQLLTLLDQEW